MTWQSFHRRGEVLRAVVSAASERRDGLLPMDVDGVDETFADEIDLLAALQLRWHTRLAGGIEQELMAQPLSLEDAVVAAWHATAAALPGVREILDRHREQPLSPAMGQAMRTATAKERTMMAMMSGLSSAPGSAAARVGARVEERARATYRAPAPGAPQDAAAPGLLGRIRAALAA